MGRSCFILPEKDKPLGGHNVSHANNKTKRKWNLNLQAATFFSNVLNRSIIFKYASTKGLRTLEYHGGIDAYLKGTKNSKLTPFMKKLKKELLQKSSQE